DRAPCPRERVLRLRAGSVDKREVGARPRQVGARRKLLQQRHRVARGTQRVGTPPRAPQGLREPAQKIASLEPVAECAPELERLLERSDAFVVLVSEEARPGAGLEQLGSLDLCTRVPEP